MKRMGFILRVLVLLAGLMVWQGKNADAHGLPGSATYHPPTQSSSVTHDKQIKAEVVAASEQQENNDCDGTCCASSLCCISAALIPAVHTVAPQSKTKISYFSAAFLPQGPPFTLLRPPRFSN